MVFILVNFVGASISSLMYIVFTCTGSSFISFFEFIFLNMSLTLLHNLSLEICELADFWLQLEFYSTFLFFFLVIIACVIWLIGEA